MTAVMGERELRAVLNELGPRIERKITRGAMGAAAGPIVKAARKNARARKITGGLAKSAGKRVKTYTKDGVVFVAAGYLWKQGGYHSHLVEFGHRIAKGGTLKRLGKHATGASKVTKLRGVGKVVGRVPGYPILAPAFQQTGSEALRIAFSEHQKRVEAEAAKLAAEKGVVK
jgi:HK97 gp10 family phage protein